MKKIFLIFSLIGLTFLSSCINSDVPDTSAQLALDIQKIEQYLADNNITDFTKDDATGVFYTIDQLGTGEKPLGTDYVNMTYVAKLFNGTVAFEQTSVPAFYTLANIGLVGLRVALPEFPEGTVATVYIPSVYAYGTGSSANIPANSNLIFEIELFDVASNEAEILEAEKTTIDNYLTENNIENVLTDASGVRYVIEEEGPGPKPTLDNSVKVNYKGTYLSNGKTFDQSTSPATFPLNGNLIQGWKKAFPLLPEGTKATLYIPSGLAYGIDGYASIPAHAILIFEVELLEVI